MKAAGKRLDANTNTNMTQKSVARGTIAQVSDFSSSNTLCGLG